VNKLSKFKRGIPFTQEEDEIIKKRVLEWGDKGSGLWVSIQKELNRPASNIIYRWNNRLNQDKKGQTFKQSRWKVQEVIMNDNNNIVMMMMMMIMMVVVIMMMMMMTIEKQHFNKIVHTLYLNSNTLLHATLLISSLGNIFIHIYVNICLYILLQQYSISCSYNNILYYAFHSSITIYTPIHSSIYSLPSYCYNYS